MRTQTSILLKIIIREGNIKSVIIFILFASIGVLGFYVGYYKSRADYWKQLSINIQGVNDAYQASRANKRGK